MRLSPGLRESARVGSKAALLVIGRLCTPRPCAAEDGRRDTPAVPSDAHEATVRSGWASGTMTRAWSVGCGASDAPS